jgi:orotate phosphoribosyltransferase
MLPAMPDGLAERLLAVSRIEGDFVLSSGRRSSVYFDKFRFLSDPPLLEELAAAAADLLPAGVSHLAAPEGAATLLLSAVALRRRLPMAVVRKAPKAYGLRTRVEGLVGTDPSHRTALIEDVSTTGGQVLTAARALEEAGATVACILLALDRGGGRAVSDAGYDVLAVASISSAG